MPLPPPSPQADEILNFTAGTLGINNHGVEGDRQARGLRGETKRGTCWQRRPSGDKGGAYHKNLDTICELTYVM